VQVGHAKEAFIVHKTLLVNASDYFAKATSGEWHEARTDVYTFDDVNVQVFRTFLCWLYTGQIQLRDTYDLDRFLILSWAIGDRIQARHFNNVIMSMMATDWNKFRTEYPRGLDIGTMIYELSQPGSKIRLLAVKKFSRHAHDEWDEDSDTNTSLEFLLDIFKATSMDVQNVRSRTLSVDVYRKVL